MSRLRVLVIDEAFPYPTDSGKRIRTFETLRRLSADFEVALAFHEDAEAASSKAERDEAARGAGIRTVAVPRRPLRKSGLRFAWDLFRNLFLPSPYMVMAHRTRALRRRVREEVASSRPDLVHVEWTPLVANVPRDLAVPVVVSAHNVESDIWRRYGETGGSLPRRAYVAIQAAKVRRFERRALAAADAVLAVSAGDAERIRSWTGQAHVTVVENGVDAERFAPDPSAPVDPDETLFVGSLDWRPNQDAVAWFLDEVLPRVRAGRPSATFRVVGRSPPSWLAARVAAVAGARLDASVPDVRPFVAGAALSIVPLRIGGGSRLKICEALAMGRPVLSTTVGAEGLEVGDGILLADGAEAFAAAVVAALSDPAGCAARAACGRARVLERHEWGRIARVQADAWREAIARGRMRPQ